MWALVVGYFGLCAGSQVSVARIMNITSSQKLCGGQRDAYARLGSMLALQKGVTIVTLGGSMTAGHGTSCGLKCAYAAKFCALLHQPNVSCVNHARGGTTTGSILPLVGGLVEGFESVKRVADLAHASVKNERVGLWTLHR